MKTWQKVLVGFIGLVIIVAVLRQMGFIKKTISEIKVDEITLNIGESKEVNTKITPDDYEIEIKSQEYEIGNESIAKYENGKVIGLADGETTIRCVIKDDTDETIKSNKAKIKVSMTEEQKKQKKEKRKPTTIEWADHSNYMFSVGNDNFDGDNVPSGKYKFYITAAQKDNKHIPIVWDIYISSNEYTNISQVKNDEYITSVGGNDELSYSIDLKKGQFVYIKYNKTVVTGSGILRIEEIIK